MKVIFRVNGGIGKNVAATAICAVIRKKYPDCELIVLTDFPVVFFCNPNVSKVLGSNDLNYFFTEHISGCKILTLLHDPFMETAFIKGEGHLLQVWCQMYGLTYEGEQPEIFLTRAEIESHKHIFSSPKPIMVIQATGGSNMQQNNYEWFRDLPFKLAQQITDTFLPHYTVIQIKRKDQWSISGTIPFEGNFRAICALLLQSELRLLINSFVQHTAAALKLPSTVCWITHDPNILGYKIHENITARPPVEKMRQADGIFTKYSSQSPSPYPDNDKIFNVDEVIQSLIGKGNIYSKIHSFHENSAITERINACRDQGSMVASKLGKLIKRTDLSNTKHILNIGSRDLRQSIEFAAIFPDARIDAFEPVPDSFGTCVENWKKLPAKFRSNVRCHKLALCAENGTIPFYSVDPENSSFPNVGASSMMPFIDGLNGTPFGQDLVQKKIEVDSIKLDDWCDEQSITAIDILWMDVQGAELHVLKGGEETLKRTKIIMTEVGLKPYYQGHTLKGDIDAFLSGLGFEEIHDAFELNGFDYEANTIYINKNQIK